MHNVTHKLAGDKLVIEIDLSKRAIDSAPPSSSGKTKLVGTTGGAVPVTCPHGNVTFALNVMCK